MRIRQDRSSHAQTKSRLTRFELAAIPRLGRADLQQWDDAGPKGLEGLVKIEQGGGIGLHDRRSW